MISIMGGATVGQWGQTVPTGKRLWGQNYVFAPTENQQVLNEEYLCTKTLSPPDQNWPVVLILSMGGAFRKKLVG